MKQLGFYHFGNHVLHYEELELSHVCWASGSDHTVRLMVRIEEPYYTSSAYIDLRMPNFASIVPWWSNGIS